MVYFRNIFQWLLNSKPSTNSDWQAITVCVVAAATFWLLYNMNLEHVTDLSYKVVFQDEQTRALPDSNAFVQFKVTGTGWNLLRERLKDQERIIYYKINRKQNTRFVLANNLRKTLNQKLTDGLKIGEIVQDTFSINFEQIISKRIPVLLNKESIRLKENIRVTSDINVEPNIVLITGSLKRINPIDSIIIDIARFNISKDFNRRFTIASFLDEKIEAVPKEVQISFQVDEFLTKIVSVPIEKSNFSEGSNFTLTQETTEVIFVCKAQEEQQINLGDFRVVADFYKIDLQDTTLTLSLEQAPEGVREAKINNKIVQLAYKKP
ncbi:MAG: hypothetical protein AAF734_04575 [Bacteroidota bacterium]